jgi:hypothetical protein
MGALITGVGAAAQAIWEHTAGYHSRLKDLTFLKKLAEDYIRLDDHHTPEWKKLILEPLDKLEGFTAGSKREIMEKRAEIAQMQINDIQKRLTNHRAFMVVGTAIAAVVFGGMMYAQARQEQESQAVPHSKIDAQESSAMPLKDKTITQERT